MSIRIGPIEDLSAWTAAARERIGDRPVICSISGGKDSTSMALLLKEAGIPYMGVHLDTGWEQKETYKYVREYLPRFVGEIRILEGFPGGMQALVEKRMAFPGPGSRFCTGELKVKPIRRFLDSLDDDPVNTVGIRAEESRNRARLPEWEYSEATDCEVWRPIINWTTEDVVAMHRRHGVRPNPLYLMGASRVGCWPCMYARKSEIRMIAEFDPGRIAELRYMETQIQEACARTAEKKGHTKVRKPTWFGYRREGWGIDDVVEWANTKGSRELLTAPSHEEGCMRWGMCETIHPIGAQKRALQELWERDWGSDSGER